MLVLIKPDRTPVRVPNQLVALNIVITENSTLCEDQIEYPEVREESNQDHGTFVCNYYVKNEVYTLWRL